MAAAVTLVLASVVFVPTVQAPCHPDIPVCEVAFEYQMTGGFHDEADGVAVAGVTTVEDGTMNANGSVTSEGSEGSFHLNFLVVGEPAASQGTINVLVDFDDAASEITWNGSPDWNFTLNGSDTHATSVFSDFTVDHDAEGLVTVGVNVTVGNETISATMWFLVGDEDPPWVLLILLGSIVGGLLGYVLGDVRARRRQGQTAPPPGPP